MRGLVLKPVRLALFSTCVLAGAALLAPQQARGGTTYEQQLSGLVLSYSEKVFVLEIVGLPRIPRPAVWPLPIWSVDQIRAALADKVLAESIFSKCSVTPTGITSTPKNYERRGWTWRTDMGDSETCRRYSDSFNALVVRLKAITPDPMYRNRFSVQFGDAVSPASDGLISPLRRARLVSSRCENSWIVSTLVP
jgi:hypothetical protein